MGASESSHADAGAPDDHAAPLLVEEDYALPVAAPGGDPRLLPTAMAVGEKSSGTGSDGVAVAVERGEVQPPLYRDWWFARAFVAQLIGVAGAAAALGPTAARKSSGDGGADGSTDDWTDAPPVEFWLIVVASSVVAAPVLSFLAMTLMSRNPKVMITASLWFSVGICGLLGVFFISIDSIVGVFYVILAVLLIWYARTARSRIPYAATNLKCGITILKGNLGLGLVALSSMAGLLFYCFGWSWAFVGTMELDSMTVGQPGNWEPSSQGQFVLFLFLLSFYWTHQVLKNIVRTTVSGVVGTWWFSPADAGSLCSAAVSRSYVRATTYSLGSICFGSLLVAILQVARNALRNANNNQNMGILRCIAGCILWYIEGLVQYFNKWAYIYIGLYGYGYIDAGKKVTNLFKKRGWETIIADNLVHRLLGVVSLAVGLVTGACAAAAPLLVLHDCAAWMSAGFGTGFLFGLVLSGVFLGLLSSAVDAVIVCYAEAPEELEENHPALAREMAEAWSEAWSSGGGIIIFGLGGGLGIV